MSESTRNRASSTPSPHRVHKARLAVALDDGWASWQRCHLCDRDVLSARVRLEDRSGYLTVLEQHPGLEKAPWWPRYTLGEFAWLEDPAGVWTAHDCFVTPPLPMEH